MSGSARDSPPLTADTGAAVGADARAGYVRRFEEARAASDVEAMTSAALALAASYPFGTFPGRVPAFLHEAYSLATGERRARLAVALARVWAYGGDPARAVRFAGEALADAEAREDGALLAQALDVELLVHWGPEDLDQRLRITARLEDTVAHLTDVEARMSAHLWRLTTALEGLDATATRRQVRALDVLAEETGSPRVRFFAAARRGMYALLMDDLAQVGRAMREAVSAGTAAAEADTRAIERTLAAGIARQLDDKPAMEREAADFEVFGLDEGVTSIAAEAAVLWAQAGRPERARPLLHQLAGADFGGIARDVDWLLTVTSLTEVAVATDARSLAECGVRLLEPYAGRGVVDGGGVAFAGVVDDYLGQACRLLGRDGEAGRWAQRAAQAYERIGAVWWLRRLTTAGPTQPREGLAHLRPAGNGIWWVGRDGQLTTIPDVKGLHYLRHLLQRPGLDVSALDLSDAVAGHPGAGVVGLDSGELLDRQALLSYRRRLAEIDEELDEALSWSDTGRASGLEDEREALLGQLRGAVGLGGRQRAAGSANERARVAVRKAIAGAIDRIAGTDPSLGRLLRDTVSTGALCRYEPDPDRPVSWVLSEG